MLKDQGENKFVCTNGFSLVLKIMGAWYFQLHKKIKKDFLNN